MKNILGLLGVAVFLFTACQKEMTEKEKSEYTIKGKEIAMATFKKLGGELEKKMKEGGVSKAAPFCNANAGTIADEVANKYKVTIKRTSDKLRNKENAPNSEEKTIIKRFQRLIAEGENLKPIVEKDKDGHPHFYSPIKLKKKCLTCHGVLGETMKHEADSIIKSLYPNDKAIGFKEGDFRGIWSISFNSKN